MMRPADVRRVAIRGTEHVFDIGGGQGRILITDPPARFLPPHPLSEILSRPRWRPATDGPDVDELFAAAQDVPVMRLIPSGSYRHR